MKPNSPFFVTWMPSGMESLSELVKRTKEPRLKYCLATIIDEIQNARPLSPKSWGDSRANLSGMEATLYIRTYVADGLKVIYAVHNSEPHVFVKGVEPIQNGPFDA